MTAERAASKTLRIDLLPDIPTKTGKLDKASKLDQLAALKRTGTPSQRKAASTTSRYQELFQGLYDAAIITSMSGKIVDANARATEFLAYERPELCQMNVSEIVPGADDSLLNTLCTNLENERFTVLQAYCSRKDGSHFPSEIAVSRLQLDDLRLCFFVRDITVRIEAEESLRIEHTAIQSSGNGIAIADLDIRLMYVNPAFARMLSHEEETLIGQDIRDLIVEQESINELIGLAMNDQRTWMNEMRMITSEDNHVFVQVSATCARDADGEASGIVFSFADITSHKEEEQQLHGAAQHDIDEQVRQRTAELEAELEQLKTQLQNKES